MSKSSVHVILARNSLANLLRYGVNIAVLFYLTPYMIKSIGDAQYGLWALAFSMVGYAGLLDMGVQLATIKLVAQYNRQGDIARLSGLCSTVLCFFTAVGFATAVVCWFILPSLMPSFITDPTTLAVSGRFLWIIGADVIFVFVGNVFVGIGLGLQQYHLRGFIDTASALLKLAGSIWVLHAGMGLLGLAWIKLGLGAMTAGVMLWVCLNTIPGLRLRPSLVSRASFLEVFSFGGKLFISSTMTRINQNSIPVVIAYFLSTVWNAYFNAASRISNLFKEVVYSLTATFLPMFSELLAAGDTEQVSLLYLRYTRFIILITLPGYVFLLLAGPTILGAWISPQYAEHGGLVLQLLILGALFEGIQPLAGRAIIGGGRLKRYVTWISCTNVLAILSSLFLVPRLGIAGAGLSLCIMSLANLVVVTVIVHEYPGVPAGSYLRILLGVLPPVMAFGVVLKLLGVNDLGLDLAGIALRGTAAFGVYAACLCFSLSSAERIFIIAYVKKLLGVQEKPTAAIITVVEKIEE